MFTRFLTLLTGFLALAAAAGSPLAGRDAAPEAAEWLAVRARVVHTESGRGEIPAVIERGMLLIRDGRIAAAGRDLPVPPGARVIDLGDGVIIPGLVDAGAAPVASTAPGERRRVPQVSGRESVSAKYLAIDEFDFYRNYADVLAGGVTTLYATPGDGRLISGRGAAAKTAGASRNERILIAEGDLCLNLCASAYGPPPLQEYPIPPWSLEEIAPAEPQRPTARLGQYLEIRESFQAARDLARLKQEGRAGADVFDYNLEVLGEALAAQPRLRIRALRAADIEGAIELARELEMDAYLTGCHEAHLAVDAIAGSGFGAVVEVPFSPDRPADELGIWPGGVDQSIGTAAALHARGVPVALTVPEDVPASELLFAAALAVRGGLSREAALAAITRRPAELLGIADRVGSLEPGRDADFVVLTAEPFEAGSHVREVFVNGRSVFSAPKGGEALVVRAGTIYTAAGPPILGGEVLVENGVIRAVGPTVPHPPGARIVDAGPEAAVTPGLIDAHGHLGLEGDRSAAGPDMPIADAVAVPQDNFRAVALSGVTTVVVAPYGAHNAGSPVAAIKTAGTGRDDLVVDDFVALKFSFRGKDPVLGQEALRQAMKKGKDYVDAWKKYADDLKKWEEEEAKKKAEGGEPAKEEKPPEAKTVEVTEQAEPDAVSGVWEGTISGGPLPEPMPLTLKLKLDADGRSVRGSFSSPTAPEELSCTGTFDGKNLVLTVDQETPMGSPVLEAALTGPDQLKGVFKLGDAFQIDFEAARTKKEAPVIKVSSRKKKTGADGRPEPPETKPELEPFRVIFAGEAAVLVEAATHREIEAVIRVVADEYKAPLVILGGDEAGDVADKVKAANTAVVAALPLVTRKDRKPYCQAVDLSRRGVPVLFQSDAEDGARSLPDMACWAVHQGMDAAAALEALTSGAARHYHIDGRVGSLQPGRDGDLVIFSGRPFDPTSRVLRVFVAGKEVEP